MGGYVPQYDTGQALGQMWQVVTTAIVYAAPFFLVAVFVLFIVYILYKIRGGQPP